MAYKLSLLAAVAATSILAGGLALAGTQGSPPAAQTGAQQTVDKDFSKLSAAGSRAYQDLTLTRLAIFDGKIADAKKYIAEADGEFTKAKTDETIFTKAEADLKSPGADDQKTKTSDAGDAAKADGTKAGTTPMQWLPVDGELSINEDYTADKTKSAAVDEANKSLAKGDRKGAMDKLKLAAVDMDVVLAVLPLDQTISDVHQAASLINDGKYYEGSQLLRKVQDSARYDMAEVDGAPKAGDKTKTPTPDTTH